MLKVPEHPKNMEINKNNKLYDYQVMCPNLQTNFTRLNGQKQGLATFNTYTHINSQKIAPFEN